MTLSLRYVARPIPPTLISQALTPPFVDICLKWRKIVANEVIIYEITNPYGVQLIDFISQRDFTKNSGKELAGDAGPEGMKFVSVGKSPNGKALLIVANEVRGSTSVYQLNLQVSL